MKTVLRLLLIGIVLILLLAAGAWWYLFGPSAVLAADLVPADTLAFFTIPNAAKLTTGYETSQLKKLIDSPDAKSLIDSIINRIGQKNVDLITTFLPNLSGQSFIAITHFDPNKPEQIGLIAAMKPKFGLSNFDAFVEKLKATYPDVLKQGTTGTGQVAGVDYQWIQGPGAPDKICVAKLNGWIVTAWGETSLQDWIERLQKKSSTPSLAQSTDYQQSLQRIGKDSLTLVYVNTPALAPLMQNVLQQTAHQTTTNNYLEKRLDLMGGMAAGASFEKGEIVDHFSFLVPQQAQHDLGMTLPPCSFDTLKFTSPDTRFYWASSVDWTQAWKNWQEQQESSPQLKNMVTSLQTWAQANNIDIQHNILDALGSEMSLQLEWGADTTYPEVGFFAKVNKPDDFKPVITAIIDTVRKTYSTDAVINEIATDEHHYATLQFVQSTPFTPTITEDGDYFGIFISQNQAVRSFTRDATIGLLNNPDFLRQIGNKRNGATQILFLDSPQLFDRGYQTAMPYLSLASMLNKNLGAALKNTPLPPDLAWLAPIGTWSFVSSTDNNGVQGYSVSGIGNQGIFLATGLGAGAAMLPALGLGFHPAPSAPPPSSPTPPPVSATPSTLTNQTSPPTPTSPDTTTNAPAPSDTTNTPPPASPPVSPDTATNSTPAPAPTPEPPPPTAPVPTPAPAATSNSDASPPTPDQPPKTQ